MTEAKRTVEEVMGLVESYVGSIMGMDVFSRVQLYRNELEAAIRALVESRDQAVERVRVLTRSNDILTVTMESDARDRDALKARVEMLEGEIKDLWWWENEDGEYGCRHCSRFTEHPEDWESTSEPIDFPHTNDCIVPTIKPLKGLCPTNCGKREVAQ